MKKYYLSFVLLVSSIIVAMAQNNDPIVMKINGKDIKKSEFEYIYSKNNNENAIDKKSLDEYIILFKNFKLRVTEAEAQGIDTTAAFHKELNEYRAQLAKSYQKDPVLNQQLLLDEYENGKELVELSSILVPFPDFQKSQNLQILPADTLEAYNKAIQIRNEYLKKGNKATFEDMVMKYSGDERSKGGDRPGYMGWVSGLKLYPALGKGIYSTPVGQVSMPIRMNYGYHLIKVLAKKADPGEINAAHILITCPADADTVTIADALNKVDSIYTQITGGADFGELAKKYSDDTGSAARGGELSWFSAGMMVPEFNDAAFALEKEGEISKPVRSQFGYHIIRLIGKRSHAPFEDKKAEIQTKLERTGYSIQLYQPTVSQLKDEYGFSAHEEAYKDLFAQAQTIFPTDSIFIDKFENSNNALFTAGGKNYTIADFIFFLKQDKRSSHTLSTELLQEKLNTYEYNTLLKVEDKSLESKHPEFKNLMQEYRDGILLFEVSNNEVWAKSSSDTLGLKNFFEENKTKYAWDKPHYKGYVVLTKNSKDKKKMQKEVSKKTPDEAAQYLLDNYKTDSISPIKIEKGLFVQGDNQYIDESIFKSGKSTFPEGFGDFFLIGKLLPNLPESYTDVRGLVITDYQDYLEKEWLESLNKKYPVEIYRDVIETIK